MNFFPHHYYQIFFYFLSLTLYTTSLQASELNLAVANSTCVAIKKVGKMFEQQHDIAINYFCKSSGRLAKGLNGSTIRADIFISANRRWMDFMIDNRLVDASKVISPWGNELVVATPVISDITISEWSQLTSSNITSILIGDPGTAPFGRYAKQAMQSTGLWEKVKSKISTKKHITLLSDTLAESDANTIGILFASNISARHRKLFSVDKSWHPAIHYYIAPVEEAANDYRVKAFLDFITGNEAATIFKAENFQIGSE